MAADVEPADKAPKMTLMLLPEEILVLILWQLFSLASPGKSSSNEPGIRRWFKYELPYVNKRIHDLLAPCLLPCLSIGEKWTQTRHPLECLISSQFAATLPHVRHLAVHWRV